MYKQKGPESFQAWEMGVQIIPSKKGDSSHDYVGFITAPFDEIQLLAKWCEQVLSEHHPVDSDGAATFTMKLKRPDRSNRREFLVGKLIPNWISWKPKPANIALPREHQAFK